MVFLIAPRLVISRQTFLPLVSVIVRVTLDLPFKSIMETRKLFVDLVLFFLLLHLQTSDNKRINSKAIWKRERGGKCKCSLTFNICSNCIFSSIQHRPVLQRGMRLRHGAEGHLLHRHRVLRHGGCQGR